MPSDRIRLGHVLLEAAIVLFGVLAALGLSEYRGARADDARAAHALSTIKAELLVNVPQLEDVLAYHTNALEQLRAARRGDSSATNPIPNGIRVASTYATAWEAARESNTLAHFPYDVTVALTRAYQPIDGYRAMTQATLQSIIAAMMSTDVDERRMVQALEPIMTDFVIMESHILESHRTALARLEDVPLPAAREDVRRDSTAAR